MFFDKIVNMLNLNFGNGNFKNQNGVRRFNNRCNCYAYKLVPFEQARNMIQTSEVLLIDIRTESEYNLMHVQNAINIPLDVLEIKIQDATIKKDKPVMIYCSSGARSKKAIQVLNKYGYNIYIWEYAALATFPYRDMLIYEKK